MIWRDLKVFPESMAGKQIATFWTPELPKSLAFPTKTTALAGWVEEKFAAPRGGSSTATPARSPARWCCCLSDPRSVPQPARAAVIFSNKTAVPILSPTRHDLRMCLLDLIGSYWDCGPKTLDSSVLSFLIVVLLTEAAICRRACDSSVLVCWVPKWDGRGKN